MRGVYSEYIFTSWPDKVTFKGVELIYTGYIIYSFIIFFHVVIVKTSEKCDEAKGEAVD